MTRKITITDSFEPVEVDLLGNTYVTVPITRSVQHEAIELEKTHGDVLNDADASPDDQVKYLADAVGLRLKPTGEGTTPASQCIVDLYNDDRLTLEQLVNLIDELGGSEANPTQ